MGEKNSSLTRVQPIFDALLDAAPDGQGWLQRLCAMAAETRPIAAAPTNVGSFAETPPRGRRMGKVFERIVPPPAAFLRWLLEHPERMEIRNPVTFGATSEVAIQWRRKLFSGNPSEREAAQEEGLRKLAIGGANGSARKWWSFEGFSHVDCCLITEQLVLFVEGKRTESVSPSTRWFTQRSQLWRNVEAARQLAAGKQFAVILAVEEVVEGETALSLAEQTVADSYPHCEEAERSDLAKHLLGFVTWRQLVAEFALPDECLPDTINPQRR
jgi:hypothetical protein